MNNKRKLVLVQIYILSFIATIAIFQNCSPNKLNSEIQDESSLESQSTYAPQSKMGDQEIVNGLVTLKEYNYKPTNKFFYTSRISDQSILNSGNYSNLFGITGNSITIDAYSDAELNPVYRLFNRRGYHLYTSKISERSQLLSSRDWIDEGIEGYAPVASVNGTCPVSPTLTYPVYRLFQNSNSKYRLVTDVIYKQYLTSVLGYVDQGILFCAKQVHSEDVAPVCPVLACAAPPTGCNYTGAPTVVDGCAVNCGTLTCSPPPPTSTYRACTFLSSTIAHGESVTAYQASSVASGSTCRNEQRTCSDGTLSGSFMFASCQVAAGTPPPAPAGVTCLSIPGFLNANPMSSSQNYRKIYSTSTLSDSSHDKSRMIGNSTVWTIPLVILANNTTAGTFAARISHAEAPSNQRASRKIVISKYPCDMTSSGNILISERSNSGAATVSINEANRNDGVRGALFTGKYYINVQSVSCTTGQYCDALIEWVN